MTGLQPAASHRADAGASLTVAWLEGGIAHLRLNRPDTFNAVDRNLALDLHAACREVAADTRLRVLLLSAAGRAFMAGGDLTAMQAGPSGASATVEAMHAALREIARLEVPVIAAVQGLVAGGGLGLSLAADVVLAADNARFNVASTLIGASPDCGVTWALPRVVGARKALELAWLCEPLNAQQAATMGLVNRVVETSSLLAEAEQLARQLALGPMQALVSTKRLMREADQRDYTTHLAAEATRFVECTRSDDFAEGVAAMLEKRRPRFGISL